MPLLIMAIWAALFNVVQAQTRRALVIGLGRQEDPAWNKINGDKDVSLVVDMLGKAGFEKKHIRTLVDDKATKAAIVGAFIVLAESAKEGDIVYIHFSGHGQQMTDRNGDEEDGKDECWIPYDAYRKPCKKDQGEKHLVDDEVHEYLTAIRDQIGDSGKLLVVIDACHSGSATRDASDGSEVVRGVGDVFKAVTRRALRSVAARQQGGQQVEREERWITISACESNQVNYEMRQPQVGKLTYALYTQIEKAATLDNDAFMRLIRKFVNSNTLSQPQRPVLSGTDRDKYNITDILR
ncbi:MAG: caspase family protein [Alloprevotella sp.]|nr:caspase family protein [Alloprevotella sp.]